jgi:hypothetical protein
MTEASVMLLYSLMNGVPVKITGFADHEIYGEQESVTVYGISKVSNAGRHEICVTFDETEENFFYDPAKIQVSLVR